MFAQVCAGGDKGDPEKIPKNNDEDTGGPEGVVAQYTFLCVKNNADKGGPEDKQRKHTFFTSSRSDIGMS